MTLLAVYETPSERKQRRRNKLEGGRPDWCPRCFDKHPSAFLLGFYGSILPCVWVSLSGAGRPEQPETLPGNFSPSR